MIRVVFELDGCSKKEAEEWGELIIDACRLDPKTVMTLAEVFEVSNTISRLDLLATACANHSAYERFAGERTSVGPERDEHLRRADILSEMAEEYRG